MIDDYLIVYYYSLHVGIGGKILILTTLVIIQQKVHYVVTNAHVTFPLL